MEDQLSMALAMDKLEDIQDALARGLTSQQENAEAFLEVSVRDNMAALTALTLLAPEA